MKNILTAAVLASAAVASAAPTTIVQTKTYSFQGNQGTENLIFNQFNAALGTLTGVYIESTGTLSGSFLVTKTGGGSVVVKNSTDNLYLTFADAGPSLTSDTLSPILTSPTTGSTGTTFNAAASPTTFTIAPSQILTLQVTDLTTLWDGWFTGLGTRTVEVSHGAYVTLVGAGAGSDFDNVSVDGSVTLTYYYNSAVPEPSTYGLALGGLALAGAVIRRRRSAK